MTIKFYKTDSKFMKEKVLEADNASNAKSNMLLIYQIFAKLVSDIYCLDYSNVENFKLAEMKSDDLHFETTGELFEKIKLLKKIGVSSFGVVMPEKRNLDLIEEKDASYGAITKTLSSYNTIKFNKGFIEDLISGFSSMDSNDSYSATKEKSIAELLTAVMFDQSAGAYYEQERIGIATLGGIDEDVQDATGINVLAKIQNYLLQQTGLKFPKINQIRQESSLADLDENLQNPGSSNRSWVNQKFSEISAESFKGDSLGILGRELIVKKELKTSSDSVVNRYVLPLETKKVSQFNEKYIAGPDFYLSEIFSNISITENYNSDFKETAKNISQKLIALSAEVIKKTGIDFTLNPNESAGLSAFDNSEYSPYHMFIKICNNIGVGLNDLKDSIKGGTKKTDFQSALVLYMLILSGENTSAAETFGIQQFWSMEAARKESYLDIKQDYSTELTTYINHSPRGTSLILANACKIGKIIIQEQLGQETLEDKGNWKKIFGNADNIVKKDNISPKKVTIGKNTIDNATTINSICNEKGSTNNLWFMSLAGFCKKDSMGKNNAGYQGPTQQDPSVTGLKYSYTSAFKGPMNRLGQNFLEKIFFYNQNGYNHYKLDMSLSEANKKIAIGKEDAGRSEGPIGFNFSQMYTVFFLFVTHLLNETLGASIEISVGGNNREKYEFKFDEIQIQAVIDALKSTSSPNLIEKENYLNTYTIANNIIARTKDVIVKKSTNILNRIRGILSIANDIVEVSKSYENYFDIENTQDPKIKTLIDFMKKNAEENDLNRIFNYMNQDALEVYSKSIDALITPSENQPAFSSNNNITDKQIKLMTLALSRRGYGYYSNEKHGKKTIINIGIPTGLVDYLRKKAYVDSIKSSDTGQPDPNYINSNYLCIQIFKNSLSPDTVTYYPKVFIFDIKRYSIENNSDISVDQIENYEDSWVYKNLQENFTFISYNKDGNVVKKTGKQIIGEASNKDIMTQLVDNHILDHYLKIYQQSTLGIDVNEYAFPVKTSIINDASLNGGRDSNSSDLFEIFENYIVQNYPSANLDPDLNFEFDRIRAQVSDSLFFKCQNKAKLLMSPKCFDRVFSLMINEEDFVIDSSQLSDNIRKISYNPEPEYTFDNQVTITPGTSITNSQEFAQLVGGVKRSHVEVEAHKKNAKGGDVPTIQQYMCNISLLKSF